MHFKHRRTLLDLDLLDNFLNNNITRKFIQFRVSNSDLRNSSTVRPELSVKLTFIDLNYVFNLLVLGNDKTIFKHLKIQNKTLNSLKGNNFEKSEHDPNKVICNFFNYQLTESKTSVLCKDLQFAFLPSKLENADFMLLFKLLFRHIKNCNLTIPQSQAVKSKLLETAFFFSFDKFNKN